MNKIIIIGHPDSSHGAVESLLMDCGMRKALPSRRDQLFPAEIHRILREAHRLPETDTIIDERGFYPVEIGAVWHSMALDLLLGNLGQEPWGWSDPQTLFFSDFWQSLDPNSVFVLVYDSPASVLRETSLNPQVEDKDAMIRKRLDNWAAYNGAMLRFYFKHMDRCVLVHSRRLQGDFRYCLDEIKAKMTAPLLTAGSIECLTIQNVPQAPDASLAATISYAEKQSPGPLIQESQTSRFFIEFQLDQLPQYVELYQELQAAASFPLQQEESPISFSAEAWFEWLLERKTNAETLEHLSKTCSQHESVLHGLKRDHQDVLLQYTATHDELEHIRLENRRVVDKAQSDIRELMEKLDESNRLAEAHWHKLSELRLESENSACEQTILRQHLELIQNELELCHKGKSDLRQNLDHHMLTSQNEREARLLTIQQIEKSHHKEKNALLLKIEAYSHSLSTLQTINKKNASEQAHLRRDLDHQVLTSQNERDALLLKIEQLEKLGTETTQAAFQSVERVKRQLSYRIGFTIVSRAKSLTGWLGMPWAILHVLKDFNNSRR